MRALLLAACLLSSAPLHAGQAAVAVPAAAADWRKADLPQGAKEALSGAGYCFEDDGRVLDYQTKAPLTPDKLAEAVARLSLSAQRAALERLRAISSKDKLDASDLAAVQALKASLPGEVAQAVEAGAAGAELRRLADLDLARIASYFDASRTMSERLAAAQPVRLGAPGPRVSLPYFNVSESRAGDSLRAAAAAAISKDPFGRTVLSRLDGADGKPELPPIVVSDLVGGTVAAYDYRRRALIVDRTTLLMSVTSQAPAKDRAALSKALASRAALVDYVASHPEAAAAFASQNDALLVHELTHAWQDRRDPVMREMARENLPQALLIEYEVEAWTTKNLYIHSRLKNEPGAEMDPYELADYQQMVSHHDRWLAELTARYGTAIADAMDIKTAGSIQRGRIELARRRAVATADDQKAKALDMLALTRAGKELAETGRSQTSRLAALKSGEVAAAARESPAVLARHYLADAIAAPNDIEFAVRIQKAEDFAVLSGDKALISEVRARKGRGR